MPKQHLHLLNSLGTSAWHPESLAKAGSSPSVCSSKGENRDRQVVSLVDEFEDVGAVSAG